MIYSAILEDILNHEYKSNQILNEKELTEKYGCSKSPVREALLTLCNEKVLRSIPRYGYEVVRLSMDDVREMLQFRYYIESGAIKNFISHIKPAQIETLKSLNEKCVMNAKDMWVHWKYNTEFHLKLMGLSGNEYLQQELEQCMAQLKRAYAQFYWDKWDEKEKPADTDNHDALIACLENQDAEGTLENLKKDLNSFACMNLNIDFGK